MAPGCFKARGVDTFLKDLEDITGVEDRDFLQILAHNSLFDVLAQLELAVPAGVEQVLELFVVCDGSDTETRMSMRMKQYGEKNKNEEAAAANMEYEKTLQLIEDEEKGNRIAPDEGQIVSSLLSVS